MSNYLKKSLFTLLIITMPYMNFLSKAMNIDDVTGTNGNIKTNTYYKVISFDSERNRGGGRYLTSRNPNDIEVKKEPLPPGAAESFQWKLTPSSKPHYYHIISRDCANIGTRYLTSNGDDGNKVEKKTLGDKKLSTESYEWKLIPIEDISNYYMIQSYECEKIGQRYLTSLSNDDSRVEKKTLGAGPHITTYYWKFMQ